MTLLAVQEVSRHFGGVIALEGVSFELAPGVIHAIIGPNGAGKTTLFNVVTGLHWPSRGSVRLAGENVTGLPPSELARRGLSRTFQNLQIFFNMTALENVMVGAHLHCDTRLGSALWRRRVLDRGERAIAAAARKLMEDVGLGAYVDAPAQNMPYGALKRLELARALASRPRLLLLDEPAAGLNPAETGDIGRLLRTIAAAGVTVVLVEHNMRLVMGVADHVLVLDRGRLIAEGTAAEVRANAEVVRAYLGTRRRHYA